MKYVNTSGHTGPEWVLSSVGVTERLMEVAREAGVEVYSVVFHHSNLPSSATISSERGLETISISETVADRVEAQIREFFGLKSDQNVEVEVLSSEPPPDPEVLFEEKSESRPDVDDEVDVQFHPSPTIITELDEGKPVDTGKKNPPKK